MPQRTDLQRQYALVAGRILSGLVQELVEYYELRDVWLQKQMRGFLRQVTTDESSEHDPDWLADQYRNLLCKLLELMSISEGQIKIYIHQYLELLDRLEEEGLLEDETPDVPEQP